MDTILGYARFDEESLSYTCLCPESMGLDCELRESCLRIVITLTPFIETDLGENKSEGLDITKLNTSINNFNRNLSTCTKQLNNLVRVCKFRS